jgi:4-hydroxybenzoate polyprenyltransferase
VAPPPAVSRRAAALAAAAHAGPSAVVTAVAAGLAVAAGGTARQAALVGAAVLAGQLSIGWANDWLDGRRGLDAGRADKPVARGDLAPAAVRGAALAAAVACAGLSLLLGPAAAGVHLLAVAGGWAYDAGLKATPASWLPYALSFGLLPTVATTAVGVGPAPAWAWAVGAAFGVAAHLTNALPDLAVDARTGVRGLPQRLGARPSTVLAAALLVAGVGVVALVPATTPEPARRLVVGALAAVAASAVGQLLRLGLGGRAEGAARAAQVAGLAVIALLVARGDALAR